MQQGGRLLVDQVGDDDERAFIQRAQRGHVRDQKRVGLEVKALGRPCQA